MITQWRERLLCPFARRMLGTAKSPSVIRSLIPAPGLRLAVPSTRMVVALGVAWILHGLEITVASAVADTLTQPETLGFGGGRAHRHCVPGWRGGRRAVGCLSDKLGRRNLFMITLGVYLVAVGNRVHIGIARAGSSSCTSPRSSPDRW